MGRITYANLNPITGDTKAGTLIGTDRFGNKFYENMEEELPRKEAPSITGERDTGM